MYLDMSNLVPADMKFRPVLAIDPSIRNLGYAILDGDATICSASFLAQTTEASIDYHIRGYGIAVRLAQLAEMSAESLGARKEPVDVIVEMPTNWFSDKAIASKDSEDIQKVYYQVGVIAGYFSLLPWVAGVWSVAPGQWKGNTPKDVMVHRAQKFAAAQSVFIPTDAPHDMCEALLLARYAMRLCQPEGYQEPIVQIYRRGDLLQGVFEHTEYIDSPETT